MTIHKPEMCFLSLEGLVYSHRCCESYFFAGNLEGEAYPKTVSFKIAVQKLVKSRSVAIQCLVQVLSTHLKQGRSLFLPFI